MDIAKLLPDEPNLRNFYFRSDVIRVIDGDTVECLLDLGFRLEKIQSVRLAFIDTPEIRGSEKEDGLKAKKQLEWMLKKANRKNMIVQTIDGENDKFGRTIGIIYLWHERLRVWQNINRILVDNKLANLYDGGAKK